MYIWVERLQFTNLTHNTRIHGLLHLIVDHMENHVCGCIIYIYISSITVLLTRTVRYNNSQGMCSDVNTYSIEIL